MADDEKPPEERPQPAPTQQPWPAPVQAARLCRGDHDPERSRRFHDLYCAALQVTLGDDRTLHSRISEAYVAAEYALIYAEWRQGTVGLPGVPEATRMV